MGSAGWAGEVVKPSTVHSRRSMVDVRWSTFDPNQPYPTHQPHPTNVFAYRCDVVVRRAALAFSTLAATSARSFFAS